MVEFQNYIDQLDLAGVSGQKEKDEPAVEGDKCLLVSGLGPGTDDSWFEEAFRKFGRVTYCHIEGYDYDSASKWNYWTHER
jgi:hypothetical protein